MKCFLLVLFLAFNVIFAFKSSIKNKNYAYYGIEKLNEPVKQKEEKEVIVSPSVLDPTPRSNVIQIGIPPATRETETYSYNLNDKRK